MPGFQAPQRLVHETALDANITAIFLWPLWTNPSYLSTSPPWSATQRQLTDWLPHQYLGFYQSPPYLVLWGEGFGSSAYCTAI